MWWRAFHDAFGFTGFVPSPLITKMRPSPAAHCDSDGARLQRHVVNVWHRLPRADYI
jgi:hypothetical protein